MKRNVGVNMSNGFRSCFLAVVSICLVSLIPGIASSAALIFPARIAILRHGINITRWYNDTTEHPVQKYTAYLSKQSIEFLKKAGFTYLRVPFSLSTLQHSDGSLNESLAQSLIRNVASVESDGIGVMLVPFHQNINLQDNLDSRKRLIKFWLEFAPMLSGLNQNLTFPEVLNEPNFRKASDWDQLQANLVVAIRKSLPSITIVVTGNKWSSIDGLAEMKLVADTNLVYSFHFYYPEFLTSMTDEIPSSDRPILSDLPFPVSDPRICQRVGDLAQDINIRRQVGYYCTRHGTASGIASRIAIAANWGRANNVAVVDTEFGIRNNRQLSTRAAYIHAVRVACEAQGIGWSLWGYDDSFGFDIKPADDESPILNQDIIKALGLASAD